MKKLKNSTSTAGMDITTDTEVSKLKNTSSTLAIIIIFVVMCTIMFIVSPGFRSITNALSVIRTAAVIIIAGIGVSFAILTGGIDLSVGSIYGFGGVVACLGATVMGLPTILAILLGILAGVAFGAFNGVMIIKAKIPPFIATLGSMQIARGLSYVITQARPVSGLPKDFLFLGQESFLEVPISIWTMVIIALLAALFMHRTVTGRHVVALGGNAEATRISGIKTNKLLVLVYTISGALAAFAGIITASKLGVGQPTAGTGFELDAIAAVVIGGASLSGGETTIIGTIIGGAIIGVLRNALVLLSIESFYQPVIIGAVILLAVTIDQLRKSNSR